ITNEEKEKIEELINQRNEAKKEKDYQKADVFREKLINMNIQIMDTATGTSWEKNSEQ
ncbi:MAG: cysteine--tRNA ligase, partial [Epsilonproteobacteria bacterium]|nr:cysteine--tRNA ligase [Campylobacterota bacterium]